MSIDDLKLMKEAIDRSGKRYFDEDELKQFAEETIIHEIETLKERREMYKNEEISKTAINNFDFFNDGYHYGIFMEVKDDNVLPATYDDEDEPVYAMQLYKKKDGELVLNENGEPIAKEQLLTAWKTRKGRLGMFIGTEKYNLLVEGEGETWIFVGGITTQYKNLTTGNYDKVKNETDKYGGESYTMNCWQIVKIKTKGKKIVYETPKINFPDED